MSLEVAIQSLADAIRLLANAHPIAQSVAPVVDCVEEVVTNSRGPTEHYDPEESPVAEKPKRRTKKKVESEPEPEVTEAPASLFDDLGLDEPEPEVEVTMEMLKTVMSELGQKKGREAVLGIFKQLKAKTFGDIKPEDYFKAYELATGNEA